MTKERMLTVLMAMTGCCLLCALVFVFCPFHWMQTVHAALDLGEFEYTPITSYLTRTLSAMYAIVGTLCVVCARDVARHLPIVRCLGIIAILGGVGVTVLDAILDLPMLWTLLEGPMTVLLGVVILGLARGTAD